jgi:hypothetical protein
MPLEEGDEKRSDQKVSNGWRLTVAFEAALSTLQNETQTEMREHASETISFQFVGDDTCAARW